MSEEQDWKEKVKWVVKDGSWFEVDDDETEGFLSFETRENGDVGEEQPGEADIAEARRLGREIVQKFPELGCALDTCDEWVSLNVFPKVRKPQED